MHIFFSNSTEATLASTRGFPAPRSPQNGGSQPAPQHKPAPKGQAAAGGTSGPVRPSPPGRPAPRANNPKVNSTESLACS